MRGKTRAARIIGLVLLGCAAMALVELLYKPGYLMKSLIKAGLFLAIPIACSRLLKPMSLRPLFRAEPKGLLIAAGFGACVFALIVGAYFLLSPYLDLSGITRDLQGNLGIHAGNFLFVAIYISLCNSFLEEFFFRGFAFLMLKEQIGKRFAYLFSAAAFAVYHVAIISGWFSPLLFCVLLGALFLAGLVFNWLDQRYGGIYVSWMVHMCANFAINFIGMRLFGLFE